MLATLKNNQYIPLDFPIPKEQVHAAVDSFMEFLREPFEVKSEISYLVNPTHRRSDIGYCFRSDKQREGDDEKEYFHYHTTIRERYPDFLHNHPVVKRFVECADPIWWAAHDTVKEFLQSHREEFKDLDQKIFDFPEPHIQLRFLKYFYKNPGRELARGHYDAGTLTLAIAESNPGLRIGRSKESLVPVTHASGKALLMPGIDFPEHVSDAYSPAWHDVIQLEEQSTQDSFSRWAVVCFFTVKGATSFSRESTHTCEAVT